MDSNKFYDTIVTKHKEYEQYNTFYIQVQEELKEKRKEELKPLEEMAREGATPDESILKNLSDKIYEYQILEKLHRQDCELLYYNLYVNVKTYMELGEGIILPKEITELCTSLEYGMPKPYFVISAEKEKLKANEFEKGRVEKRIEEFKKYEIHNVLNIVKQEMENSKE